MDLDATDEQLDSPDALLLRPSGHRVLLSGCAGQGSDARCSRRSSSTSPLRRQNVDAPFQMLVSSIDYNEFVGRIAIGRIERGVMPPERGDRRRATTTSRMRRPRRPRPCPCMQFEGLQRVPVTEAEAGSIIAMSGIGDITIGDTICAPSCVEPLAVCQDLRAHDGDDLLRQRRPVCRPRGQVRHQPPDLRERLHRETLKDVSLRVTDLEGATDSFNVAGRGEMSLSILIETMRREGYEFQVSPPRVLLSDDQRRRSASPSNASSRMSRPMRSAP